MYPNSVIRQTHLNVFVRLIAKHLRTAPAFTFFSLEADAFDAHKGVDSQQSLSRHQLILARRGAVLVIVPLDPYYPPALFDDICCTGLAACSFVRLAKNCTQPLAALNVLLYYISSHNSEAECMNLCPCKYIEIC